jgi:hypothetical protein
MAKVEDPPGVTRHASPPFLVNLSLGASRENLPLFALRRDQQKGFDRPSPQGFYNAVHAYGFPEEHIRLNVDAFDVSIICSVLRCCILCDSFPCLSRLSFLCTTLPGCLVGLL